jgi:hypothetical protein
MDGAIFVSRKVLTRGLGDSVTCISTIATTEIFGGTFHGKGVSNILYTSFNKFVPHEVLFSRLN